MSVGFNQYVCPTDQATVLQAAVLAIQLAIPESFTDVNCFLSDVPWPDIETSDNLFCTVCPAPGSFDPDAAEAGSAFVVERSVIQVTFWTRLWTDQLDRSTNAFVDAQRGLLSFKQKILKALSGKQLFSDAPDNTIPLLIDYLKPTRAMHPPVRESQDDFSSFSLTFDAAFTWDLS